MIHEATSLSSVDVTMPRQLVSTREGFATEVAGKGLVRIRGR
jgi:hypothetical protein